MEDPVLHLATQAGLLLAQDADSTTGDGYGVLLFYLLIFGGVFYFFIFRPRRRYQRQRQELQSALSIGDEVRTIGGIYGRVENITEGDIVIDAGGGTKLRISKGAIAERMGGDTA
jgi:preprotein translocase subunit YajC